jgi:hypothetical protein
MLILGLSLLAAASAADQDRVSFDIQCVIATQTAMANAKPEMKLMLMSAMTYFTGRVDAEIAAGELENRLVAQSKTLEGTQVGPLLQQCGAFMKARGKVWTDMGERLQSREDSTHRS